MAIPLFLAVTPEESGAKAEHFAWMACHFSGKGLIDLPRRLPQGAMVIVNDEVPLKQPDGEFVSAQLAELDCSGILLDFQRQGCQVSRAVAATIVKKCPCPVGVTEYYAQGLDCPVFLGPVPPDRPLEEYLNPWKGREIWLDAAPSPTRITVTQEGSRMELLGETPTEGHQEKDLCCHYRIRTAKDKIKFDLWRTGEDIQSLLAQAEACGVTRGVGLWQELEKYLPLGEGAPTGGG